MADLDYKRPKIDVYIMNDIFNQCANPLESEDLHDMSSTKENEDEQMKSSSAFTSQERKHEAMQVDYEECHVPKPTKEDVYNDEDYEFMSLVPEPHEPKLFELT